MSAKPAAKPACCKQVWSGYHSYPCRITRGMVKREGAWYCSTHDPVARAAKNAERNRERDARWAIISAQDALEGQQRAVADVVERGEYLHKPQTLARARAKLVAARAALDALKRGE